MSDMADYAIEQGMDMLAAHQSGHCLQDCIYCEEEDDEIWYTESKDEV